MAGRRGLDLKPTVSHWPYERASWIPASVHLVYFLDDSRFWHSSISVFLSFLSCPESIPSHFSLSFWCMNLTTEGKDQLALGQERLDLVIVLICVISQGHEPPTIRTTSKGMFCLFFIYVEDWDKKESKHMLLWSQPRYCLGLLLIFNHCSNWWGTQQVTEWGLVFLDLWQAIIPLPPSTDEKTWIQKISECCVIRSHSKAMVDPGL